MPTWLATTASVIAGGVLTMLAAWLGDRRVSERDRERRRDERRERLVTRRDDFQRETLLALQQASQRLLRITGASLHQDMVSYRSSGKWQRQQLPDELSNDHLRFTTDTMLLASRVRDDRIRSLAERLLTQAAVVGTSRGESESESRMTAAADTQSALIRRIGEVLRGLDEAD